MKLKFIILLFLISIFSFAEAQGGAPPPGPETTSGPIDGGAIFLLVVVGLYGFLKFRNKPMADNASAL